MKYLVALLLLVINLVQAGEVIPVQPIEKCFLCSNEPSMTMYWQGKNSKAVLIFIPGGEGYLGLKQGQTEIRGQIYQTLSSLSDPAKSSGHFDVVLLDSPAELSPRQPYPSDRAGADHLIRIESAIRYYKNKTGLPVWLMGHSNGGISLTEFVKYAQKNNKLDLISGIVASSIRTESHFEAPIPFPMLFIHHEKDGCQHCLPPASYANYEMVKQFSTSTTDFVYVTTGNAQPNDPCRSGFHMYNDAGDEVSKYLDDFISRQYK